VGKVHVAAGILSQHVQLEELRVQLGNCGDLSQNMQVGEQWVESVTHSHVWAHIQ
jgi:hypothetical protein